MQHLTFGEKSEKKVRISLKIAAVDRGEENSQKNFRMPLDVVACDVD